MPFKTITVKESTYRRLLRAKRKGESFSELLDRSFADEGGLARFAGTISESEANEAMRIIRDERRRATADDRRRTRNALP